MKFNWNPSNPAFLDFETQSPVPLSSAHKYARNVQTKALTCVVKCDGQEFRMGPYLNGEDCELLEKIAEDHTLVAHNAMFDGAIWEHTLKLDEATWCDTLPLARAAGLPGKLDELGTLLTREGKDKRGKMLIDLLCINRGAVPPPSNPAYKLLLEYNARDVELLETVFHRVKGYGEPDIMTVDWEVNNRGMPICKPYLEAMRDLYVENSKEAGKRFDELATNVNPKSPKQVTEWMGELGFNVKRIDKASLREFLREPEKFFCGDEDMGGPLEIIREAMDARAEVVQVGAGKLNRALEAVENDGRMRDQFVIYGAIPGRWTGRGMQPHNMPLAIKDLDVRAMPTEMKAVKAAAAKSTADLEYSVATANVLNSMLRQAVRADNLLVADYNAVELRCCAWLSECQGMLTLLSDPLGKSVYLDYGAKAFGRPITKKDVREYALCKSLVLGSTYGMSATKFQWTLERRSKVAIKIMGETGMSSDALVKLFRETYAEIPLFWRALGDAVLRCVRTGADVQVGRLYFHMQGPDMHMVLPSGRPIVYRNAHIEDAVPKWQLMLNMTPRPIPTVFYDSPRFKHNYLYGSKICENACQGTCRDLLARALVNWTQAGFHPVGHVHDEGICEDPPERFDEYMAIMSDPPDWADGFPLLVEGYSGPMWSKVTKGWVNKDYFNGKELKK